MSGRARRSAPTSKSGYSSDAASSDGGMAGSSKRGNVDKASDEYKRRRERNNEAVKKSRSKAKERTTATQHRVNILQAENNDLSSKISILNKEFELLKEMYTAHAKIQHPHEAAQLEEQLQQLTNYSYVKDEPRHS